MPDTKVYRGRETAHTILNRVLQGGAYSNLVLTSTFEKNPELSPEDRRMAMSLVFGVLRNLTLLDEVFRMKAQKGKLSMTPGLLLIGRMAIYELMFNTKVPAYASASEYIKMARASCSVSEAKFLNAVLRRVTPEDKKAVLERAQGKEAKIALEYSHPEWFVKSAINAYGIGECMKMIRAHNTGMPAYYRVNTAKMKVRELLEIFHSMRLEVETVKLLPAAIYFKSGQSYFPSKEYEAGWITPQDLSTQIVAYELGPKPGERILDLCCGRGTKTTHAAELMRSKGSITACDVYGHKITLLEAEKKRLGFESMIKGVAVDVTTRPDLGEPFDRVLLDAPCSGTGTFRRRPELKYRITVENLRNLIALQRSLLSAAADYVKPGGRLLYSTCSVLTEENDDVVEVFLKERPDFSIDRPASAPGKIPCCRTPFSRVFLPHQTQASSIAITILKRQGEEEAGSRE